MPKPTRIGVTHPPEHAMVASGRDITVAAEGESSDAGAAGNIRTGVLVRVFYRVKGIPVAVTLYNGLVDHNPSGAGPGKKFKLKTTGENSPFRPDTKTHHSVRVIGWDHRQKQNGANDIKQKVIRFKVV